MLKVGDRVRIKSFGEIEDTIIDEPIGSHPGFVDSMMHHCGKSAKIVCVCGSQFDWFVLDIDDREWAWWEKWIKKENLISLNDDLFEI